MKKKNNNHMHQNRKMKPLLLIITLSISCPVFPYQNILGGFSTVSESECNSEIHFFKNGKGTFLESCRIGGVSYTGDDQKTDISWSIQNKNIIVKINGINEIFTYHDKLSCVDFGEKGHANGLVGFDYHFWKKPITCK